MSKTCLACGESATLINIDDDGGDDDQYQCVCGWLNLYSNNKIYAISSEIGLNHTVFIHYNHNTTFIYENSFYHIKVEKNYAIPLNEARDWALKQLKYMDF